jgi:transposase InsO family protein
VGWDVRKPLSHWHWAYQRPYTSNTERTAALDAFLHSYNYHRCHTALGGQPPVSRVNNASGQYT